VLPADTIAEITTNLVALHLEPNTAAQILAAVLAPLMRNSGPDPEPERPCKRVGRPRGRPRRRALIRDAECTALPQRFRVLAVDVSAVLE